MDLDDILKAVQEKNKQHAEKYAGIMKSNSKLLKSYLVMKKENEQLRQREEQLRNEMRSVEARKSIDKSHDEMNEERFKVQNELTTLLREKGESFQKIIELNTRVEDLQKQISSNKTELLVKDNEIDELKSQVSHLNGQIHELTATNQMLKDEQQGLQLEYVCMEEKYTSLKDEHEKLIERWLAAAQVKADTLNAEAERFRLKKHDEQQKKLKEAISRRVEIADPKIGMPICLMTTLPSKAQHVFDAHKDDINAVRWSPSGNMFATTGQDRKVKIWEIVNYKCEELHTLAGSNGAGMSVDFDFEASPMVLAGSSDYACRVWGVGDQRLRHTLTGHANKVYSARFIDGDSSKVVSGSQDKTLRVWDLKCGACTKVHFAGSSCYDVITYSNMIMSGHFDKKVRFWHRGADQPTDEITLGGRITSLDLSPDKNKLLCCTKENNLKLIDIRNNNRVVSTFSAANFHVGLDYSKASFSPDGEYICAGSQDGTVYIWNVNNNKLERQLKEHTASVTACSWHPTGNQLISVDRHGKAILWSDF